MSAERSLQRVGEQVRQGQSGLELDEEQGLARFRQVVDRGVVQTAPRRRWLALPLVAAAMAVAAFVLWPHAAITFAVDGGPEMPVATWIDAKELTTVRFSDGTRVSALEGSRWRVSHTTPDGANLQLERGELTAEVRSRESSLWLIDAGPFSIRVTGTRFATSWDPVGQVFELQMQEGTVVLAGPVVGGQREVRAPEHLRIDVATQRLAVVGADRTTAESAPPSTSHEASTSPEEEPVPREAPLDSASSVPLPSLADSKEPIAPQAHEVESWVELAQSGKHAEALRAIADVASVLGAAGPGRLLLLAQTARLAGDHALASRALAALAARHPNSVEGKTALFLDGKVHFDRGRYDEAVTELSRYLNAAPQGAFAREAQVLLILALHHGGRVPEAQALAGRFLAAHPNSPHAARLRSIVSPP